MLMKSDNKRKGRPAKPPEPGTKVSLGLKVSAEVKAWLDERAAANGRTQSQEAVWLMEQGLLYETQKLANDTKGAVTLDQVQDMIERHLTLQKLQNERS
jgi:hypothetical protein